MKTKQAAKHTPGPWRPTTYTRKPGEVFIVGPKGEARPPICACHPDNANLIAAAPELLKVAKWALIMIEAAEIAEECEAGLRAAIAKAEGK